MQKIGESIKEFLVNIPRTVYAIFFSSIVLRLFVLVWLLAYGGQDELLWGDSTRYLAVAKNLLSGAGFMYKGIVDAYRAPGYPLFLLLFEGLHLPLWFGSIIQIFISSLIPVGVYYVAKRYLSLPKNWAIFATLLAVVEPVQVYFGVVLLPDVLFSTFFLAGILLLLRWLTHQNIRLVVWAGVCVGVANYIRPAGLYLPIFVIIFFLLYMWTKKISFKNAFHLGIFAVAMFFVMLPWYVHNYIQFGKVGFVSAGSYNLYVYGATSTEALATGETYEKTYTKMMSELQANAPDKANKWSLKNEPYLKSRSKEIILAHPVLFAKNYLAGLNNFLFSGNYHHLLYKYQLIEMPERISFSFFLNDNGVVAAAKKFTSLVTTPYFFLATVGKIFWVVLVFGSIIGMFLYRKTDLALIFFMTALYFAFTVVSVTIGSEARHRYALNPPIFLFFTAFVYSLYARFKSRKSQNANRETNELS